jgi:hypothetical protein
VCDRVFLYFFWQSPKMRVPPRNVTCIYTYLHIYVHTSASIFFRSISRKKMRVPRIKYIHTY